MGAGLLISVVPCSDLLQSRATLIQSLNEANEAASLADSGGLCQLHERMTAVAVVAGSAADVIGLGRTSDGPNRV